MKPILSLLALVVALTALPGCGCFTPEKRNEPACAVLHQVIDCTTDALKNIGPVVAAMIRTYVSDPNQTPNWDGLIGALEGAGIKDGGCIVAQLMADFIGKPSADPMRMVRAKEALSAFERYKFRHQIAGVKYKVIVDGKVVLL